MCRSDFTFTWVNGPEQLFVGLRSPSLMPTVGSAEFHGAILTQTMSIAVDHNHWRAAMSVRFRLPA